MDNKNKNASDELHDTLTKLLLVRNEQSSLPSIDQRHEAPSRLDADGAAALTLAALYSDKPKSRKDALNDMEAQVATLVAEGNQGVVESLARQAAVLEGVFMAYTVLASRATKPAEKASAMRTALNAQRALMPVLGALDQVKRRGGADAGASPLRLAPSEAGDGGDVSSE